MNLAKNFGFYFWEDGGKCIVEDYWWVLHFAFHLTVSGYCGSRLEKVGKLALLMSKLDIEIILTLNVLASMTH